MATSRLYAVMDATRDKFTTALAGEPTLVKLGYSPLPAGSLEWVLVGSDGEPIPEDDVASSTIQWAAIGNQARMEVGRVVCCALSQSGDPDAGEAMIARSFALLALLENAVLADVTLGGVVTVASAVEDPRLRVWSNSDGVAALVIFLVTFKTRI